MTKSDESVDFDGETNPNLSLQNEFLNIFYRSFFHRNKISVAQQNPPKNQNSSKVPQKKSSKNLSKNFCQENSSNNPSKISTKNRQKSRQMICQKKSSKIWSKNSSKNSSKILVTRILILRSFNRPTSGRRAYKATKCNKN